MKTKIGHAQVVKSGPAITAELSSVPVLAEVYHIIPFSTGKEKPRPLNLISISADDKIVREIAHSPQEKYSLRTLGRRLGFKPPSLQGIDAIAIVEPRQRQATVWLDRQGPEFAVKNIDEGTRRKVNASIGPLFEEIVRMAGQIHPRIYESQEAPREKKPQIRPVSLDLASEFFPDSAKPVELKALLNERLALAAERHLELEIVYPKSDFPVLAKVLKRAIPKVEVSPATTRLTYVSPRREEVGISLRELIAPPGMTPEKWFLSADYDETKEGEDIKHLLAKARGE